MFAKIPRDAYIHPEESGHYVEWNDHHCDDRECSHYLVEMRLLLSKNVVHSLVIDLVTKLDGLVALLHNVLAVMQSAQEHPHKQTHLRTWFEKHVLDESLFAFEFKI